MPRFQIRRGDHGVALYVADDGREALLDFLADAARAESRPDVELHDDGSATVTVDGETLSAVSQ